MCAWLIRHDGKEDDTFRAIAELDKESDRSAAIVAGSIVENGLTLALKANLHKNEAITNELFRTSGPVGAFGTKIHLAYLVGLLSAEAHRELVTFKDIRNAFAHSLVVRDFKSDKIRGLCNNLKLFERHTFELKLEGDPPEPQAWGFAVANLAEATRDPRARYILSARVFTLAFGRSIQAIRSPAF